MRRADIELEHAQAGRTGESCNLLSSVVPAEHKARGDKAARLPRLAVDPRERSKPILDFSLRETRPAEEGNGPFVPRDWRAIRIQHGVVGAVELTRGGFLLVDGF